MKILLFSHAFYPNIGGIESISLMLASNFYKRQGVSVIVISRTKEEGTKEFPFQVVRDPSVGEVIRLLSWCDLVFENNPCLGLTWPNLVIRKPKIVGLQTWITPPNEKGSIQSRWKKRILQDYNAVIACSTKIKMETYNTAHVIGNPYDSVNFKPTQIEKKLDFVFVGRLVSDKGADMCVELLRGLYEAKNKIFSLTIIGDGPEMNAIKELAAHYKLVDNIRFLGFLVAEEIAEELNRHQFLLVPSRWEEPFGIVALEGMACGCIPIVSDGGGLPDAVGQAGIVFERNSVASLVEKTIELLDHQEQQQRLLQNAAAHLKAHTEVQVAQEYFDLFQKALKG